MSDIIFTIIMPTYNSERTLDRALNGIRMQKFNQEQIEILVVDGGSTDQTIKIAIKYGARIVNNPERLPEPAKLYGMKEAKGHYICVMGSDEVMVDDTIYERRYHFLQTHPEVHGMLAELRTPGKYNPCCNYMNAVGDPFTCFVYQIFGDKFQNLKRKFYKQYEDVLVYKFKKDDIIPIGDGGTLIDMDYLRMHYSEEVEKYETSILWDILIRDTEYVACMKDDFVEHYSKTDFKTYLSKLRFRVINNIHNVKGSGYAYRAETNENLNSRKYLFPLYCLSIILPIIDGIRMKISFKHWIFLVHPLFCWYVLFEITVQYLKKMVGKKSVNSIYGEVK